MIGQIGYEFKTKFEGPYNKVNKGTKDNVNLQCFPSCSCSLKCCRSHGERRESRSGTFCGNKIEVLVDLSNSSTPLSDFLFTVAFSYEGNTSRSPEGEVKMEKLIELHNSRHLTIADASKYASFVGSRESVPVVFDPAARRKSPSWTLYPKNCSSRQKNERWTDNAPVFVEVHVYVRDEASSLGDGNDSYRHMYKFQSSNFGAENLKKNNENKLKKARKWSKRLNDIFNGSEESSILPDLDAPGQGKRRRVYHSHDVFNAVLWSVLNS